MATRHAQLRAFNEVVSGSAGRPGKKLSPPGQAQNCLGEKSKDELSVRALRSFYHFFNRQSQKMNPPAIVANRLMTKNGHQASSIGNGRATFIEKMLMTRFASMMATVQMVNFLM